MTEVMLGNRSYGLESNNTNIGKVSQDDVIPLTFAGLRSKQLIDGSVK